MRVVALEPPIALPGAAFADTLSVGEIGCYASHMKAWDALLASRSLFALVLEDDARVSQNPCTQRLPFCEALGSSLTSTIATNTVHGL
jgi:GR25 family glycosyltransferase involved in LPS biosynthesis